MSVNNTSPGTLFGGTWAAIEGKFLVGADSTFTAGGTGGNDKHTHTYEHTHTTPATTTGSHTLVESEVPAHTHTRGTMNITGSTGYISDHAVWGNTAIGAFSGYTSAGGSITDVATNGTSARYQFNFDASRNWTGATSSYGGGGGHTHSQVTTTTDSQSTSTTSETSNLPPYLSVYMWKRTA